MHAVSSLLKATYVAVILLNTCRIFHCNIVLNHAKSKFLELEFSQLVELRIHRMTFVYVSLFVYYVFRQLTVNISGLHLHLVKLQHSR